MRVLIILKNIPSTSDDQKSDLVYSAIKAHELKGYEVVLMTTGSRKKHKYDEIVISWVYLKKLWAFIIKRLFNKDISDIVSNAVLKYHSKQPIDIMLAECNGDQPAFHAYAINKRLGIPYVVWEHRSILRSKESVKQIPEKYLLALRSADSVMAVSPVLAEKMVQAELRESVGCIPNALSDYFFSPPDGANPYSVWADGSYIFAGWTRWRNIKRVDLLLKAFKRLLEQDSRVKLIIAGPIEPEDNAGWVKAFINENSIDNHVLLTGQLSRYDIHKLAYSCDCCVIPSDYETFGLPALEAMAAGKPVVATRCNGPEFLIDSPDLGRTVDCDSVDQLYSAMLDVYINSKSFSAERIRQSAYKRFSCKAVAEKFNGLYLDILETKLTDN